MNMKLLILVVSICRALVFESTLSKTQLIRAYKFATICPEVKEKDMLLIYTNASQKEKGNINFTQIIKENIIGNVAFYVDLTICQVKEAPDTCKKFLTYKTSNWCSVLESKDNKTIWGDWDTCVHPRIRCPLKKGIYKLINCNYTIHNFNMFPVKYGNYRVKFKFMNMTGKSANLFSCSDYEFDIVRRRLGA